MSITGRRDGEPGAGPQKVGVALTDVLTGLYATIGVLAALAHRDAHRARASTSTSRCSTCRWPSLANQAMNYLDSAASRRVRMGNAHPNIVPYQDFPTADGDMIVAVGNDSQFARLCAGRGRSGMGRGPALRDQRAPGANRDDLIAAAAPGISRRARPREWVAALEAAGVPCGPINTIDRGVRRSAGAGARPAHRPAACAAGTVPLWRNPIRLSATPVAYDRAPPLLGEHTDEVLQRVAGPGRRRTAAADRKRHRHLRKSP